MRACAWGHGCLAVLAHGGAMTLWRVTQHKDSTWSCSLDSRAGGSGSSTDMVWVPNCSAPVLALSHRDGCVLAEDACAYLI